MITLMSRVPGDTKAVRVRIHGRVQRVGFLYWAIDVATRRGLDGWVRNCVDGTVEAVFVGPATDVDGVLSACRVGPPAALVGHADVANISAEEASALIGRGFTTRRTE